MLSSTIRQTYSTMRVYHYFITCYLTTVDHTSTLLWFHLCRQIVIRVQLVLSHESIQSESKSSTSFSGLNMLKDSLKSRQKARIIINIFADYVQLHIYNIHIFSYIYLYIYIYYIERLMLKTYPQIVYNTHA